MKVRKDKFDAALAKMLGTKPKPKKAIKTSGKRGSKKAVITLPHSQNPQ